MAKKNDLVENLSIESIGFEGKSIARKDGLVYFVDKGVPGDTVVARVKKKKRSYTIAEIVSVEEPSTFRETPVCEHFGVCGGCRWQHMQYSEQLRWKYQHVKDAFERSHQVSYTKLHDTLPNTTQYWYRNKMDFSFGKLWLTNEQVKSGNEFDTAFAVGLHAPGRYEKVLDIKKCYLHSEQSNSTLSLIREKGKELGTTVYDSRSHNGFLRNLVLRSSYYTKDYMAILVTATPTTEADKKMIEWFRYEFPNELPKLTTAIHAVTDSKASVAIGTPEVTFGEGFITEKLFDISFQVSPFSFFQTNTVQAERLFNIVFTLANITKDSTVWDLYCGTGSISLPVARLAKKVIGIEIVESAIKDARSNAVRNNLNNTEFHVADMKDAAKKDFLQNLDFPDVIIVDPPRAGLHPDVVKTLLSIQARAIVYVSCNPMTQARDCELLQEAYEVHDIYPVDMFPNTYHIENVAKLVLKSS